MLFDVQMIVELKAGLNDPQGAAIEGALPALGWDNVSNVRAGRFFHFVIDATDEDAVCQQAKEMAERFLTNPVIEGFTIVDVAHADAQVAGTA